jgi:hypothetical protein
MTLEFPITKSGLRYGYIFWHSSQDVEAKQFFGARTTVEMWMGGSYLGQRSIDWKSRRIFVGRKSLKEIPEYCSIFHLQMGRDSVVYVSWHWQSESERHKHD